MTYQNKFYIILLQLLLNIYKMNELPNRRLLKVGTIIKELRESRGLTQKQLCALTDIGLPALAKIERNVTLSPSIITLAKMASYFDVGIETIIHIESPHTTQKGGSMFYSKESEVLEYLPEFLRW